MTALWLLLLVLVGVSPARADAPACDLILPSHGRIPMTSHQNRQCIRKAVQILALCHRLCDKYGGTVTCVRLCNPESLVGGLCGVPIPTVAECCAAGVPLFPGFGSCPCGSAGGAVLP